MVDKFVTRPENYKREKDSCILVIAGTPVSACAAILLYTVLSCIPGLQRQ
jgi:hypothetical protein